MCILYLVSESAVFRIRVESEPPDFVSLFCFLPLFRFCFPCFLLFGLNFHLNFNPLSHPYFRLSETTLVRPPSIDRFQFVALPISLLSDPISLSVCYLTLARARPLFATTVHIMHSTPKRVSSAVSGPFHRSPLAPCLLPQ